MNDAFHVAIVGAGPGGLCLAQALTRAGIRCDVYERDGSANERTQGYRIRIDAAGQRALAKSLTPAMDHALRLTASLATSPGQILDTQLQPINAQRPDSWQDDEEQSDLGIHRQSLREVLMTGIRDRVHFGHAFAGYDTLDDGRVRVAFDNATSVTTDVLVGADGVHSRVRTMLAPEATPTLTDAVCLYGRSTPHAHEALMDGTRIILAQDCAAIIEAMRFRHDLPDTVSPVDDYLYWALLTTRERLGLSAALAGDVPVAIERITHAWHPTLRSVMCSSGQSDIAIAPVRTGRTDVRWKRGRGRVTLLGDAIHAMSPAGGRGANMALEDAGALATCLAGAPANPYGLTHALDRYEAEMRRRADEAIAVSVAGMDRLLGKTT